VTPATNISTPGGNLGPEKNIGLFNLLLEKHMQCSLSDVRIATAPHRHFNNLLHLLLA